MDYDDSYKKKLRKLVIDSRTGPNCRRFIACTKCRGKVILLNTGKLHADAFYTGLLLQEWSDTSGRAYSPGVVVSFIT